VAQRSLVPELGQTFGYRPRRSSLAVTTPNLNVTSHRRHVHRSTTTTTTPFAFAGSVAGMPTPGWRDSGAPQISYVTGSEMKTQYCMRFTLNDSFFSLSKSNCVSLGDHLTLDPCSVYDVCSAQRKLTLRPGDRAEADVGWNKRRQAGSMRPVCQRRWHALGCFENSRWNIISQEL